MRRFSQRNSLVTLSDINITPLLDLAFVLLIIFVITTPLLEKGLDAAVAVDLRAERRQQPRKSDIRVGGSQPAGTVCAGPAADVAGPGRPQPGPDAPANPNLVVDIRADKKRADRIVDGPAGRLPAAGHHQMSVRGNPRPNPP